MRAVLSVLSEEKKLSIAALSQTLPERLIPSEAQTTTRLTGALLRSSGCLREQGTGADRNQALARDSEHSLYKHPNVLYQLRPVFPSVQEGDVQGGVDSRDGKRETGEAHCHHHWNLHAVRVNVVLNHHLDAKGHVVEKRDQ